MGGFQISRREMDNAVILDLSGELETFAISDLKKEIDDLMRNGQNMILLNLKDVVRFNSTALGILIGRLRHGRISGGDIKIFNVTPQIRKMFNLMGVTRVFDVHETEEDALESISGNKA